MWSLDVRGTTIKTPIKFSLRPTCLRPWHTAAEHAHNLNKLLLITVNCINYSGAVDYRLFSLLNNALNLNWIDRQQIRITGRKVTQIFQSKTLWGRLNLNRNVAQDAKFQSHVWKLRFVSGNSEVSVNFNQKIKNLRL